MSFSHEEFLRAYREAMSGKRSQAICEHGMNGLYCWKCHYDKYSKATVNTKPEIDEKSIEILMQGIRAGGYDANTLREDLFGTTAPYASVHETGTPKYSYTTVGVDPACGNDETLFAALDERGHWWLGKRAPKPPLRRMRNEKTNGLCPRPGCLERGACKLHTIECPSYRLGHKEIA